MLAEMLLQQVPQEISQSMKVNYSVWSRACLAKYKVIYQNIWKNQTKKKKPTKKKEPTKKKKKKKQTKKKKKSEKENIIYFF